MLEARNIHKTYENGKKTLNVLKGIDLRIEKGKFAAIVGPSGAGKSTLLNILGGLDLPNQGVVSLEGDELYSLDELSLSAIRNKKIGLVFQFYHLLHEFTVMENVLLPSLIAGNSISSDSDSAKRARILLEKTGLIDRSSYFPSELSGGEKQRVAIVRALINNPELLLCDEPTGNLDSDTGNEIFAFIKQINRERRMTVVMVTHNLELARCADEVYKLKDGLLVN